jgi:hypothetical protein
VIGEIERLQALAERDLAVGQQLARKTRSTAVSR